MAFAKLCRITVLFFLHKLWELWASRNSDKRQYETNSRTGLFGPFSMGTFSSAPTVTMMAWTTMKMMMVTTFHSKKGSWLLPTYFIWKDSIDAWFEEQFLSGKIMAFMKMMTRQKRASEPGEMCDIWNRFWNENYNCDIFFLNCKLHFCGGTNYCSVFPCGVY